LYILEKYNSEILNDNYISVEYFMAELQIPNRGSTTAKSVFGNLENYKTTLDLDILSLPEKYTFIDGYKSKYAINKNVLKEFKNNFVSFSYIKEYISYTVLKKIIIKHNLNVIKLQQTVATGMFINKDTLNGIDDYTNLLKEKKLSTSDEFVNKSEVRIALGISAGTLDVVIKEYNIETQKLRRQSFIHKDDFQFLVSEQSNARKLLKEYYLASEAKKLLNRGFLLDELTIERIPCPNILPISSASDKGGYLWKKSDVDNFIDQRERQRELREFNKIELETPFETFLYRLDTNYEKDFSSTPITKELWFNYVKNSLNYGNASQKTLFKYVGQFIEVTKTLFDNITDEIHKISSNEINLRLLNHTIEISHRLKLYLFLKKVAASFEDEGKKTVFVIRYLNDPYKNYEPNREFDKSLYTIDEYQSLFTFCSNIKLHKINAINDVIAQFNNKKASNYDSVWLYVLTHLTNNWRHNTVLEQLPRIDLSRTKISSLDWLLNNDISREEAKDIIYQIGRKVIEIEKTGAEGTFNIPESLEIPFATAISICELRLRQIGLENNSLIHLPSDKTINSPLEGSFFYNYPNNDFVFENRKMNRTLTTFIWSIIRYFSNGENEALLAAQFSRQHYQESTTNIYITLTQNQIDSLTEQLFARDQFGFVYKLFNDILLEDSETKMDETKSIVQIQNQFGDIYKIEATAGFLNRIANDDKMIENYLLSKSPSEIKGYYYLMLANLLPSKDKHYQCIQRECINIDLNCYDCLFSIPNVYALSNTLERYVKQIENLLNFEKLPLGERNRQANQFYLIRKMIESARERFGDDIIYTFLPGGKDRIKELQKLMPPKSLVTSHITLKEGMNQ